MLLPSNLQTQLEEMKRYFQDYDQSILKNKAHWAKIRKAREKMDIVGTLSVGLMANSLIQNAFETHFFPAQTSNSTLYDAHRNPIQMYSAREVQDYCIEAKKQGASAFDISCVQGPDGKPRAEVDFYDPKETNDIFTSYQLKVSLDTFNDCENTLAPVARKIITEKPYCVASLAAYMNTENNPNDPSHIAVRHMKCSSNPLIYTSLMGAATVAYYFKRTANRLFNIGANIVDLSYDKYYEKFSAENEIIDTSIDELGNIGNWSAEDIADFKSLPYFTKYVMIAKIASSSQHIDFDLEDSESLKMFYDDLPEDYQAFCKDLKNQIHNIIRENNINAYLAKRRNIGDLPQLKTAHARQMQEYDENFQYTNLNSNNNINLNSNNATKQNRPPKIKPLTAYQKIFGTQATKPAAPRTSYSINSEPMTPPKPTENKIIGEKKDPNGTKVEFVMGDLPLKENQIRVQRDCKIENKQFYLPSVDLEKAPTKDKDIYNKYNEAIVNQNAPLQNKPGFINHANGHYYFKPSAIGNRINLTSVNIGTNGADVKVLIPVDVVTHDQHERDCKKPPQTLQTAKHILAKSDLLEKPLVQAGQSR